MEAPFERNYVVIATRPCNCGAAICCGTAKRAISGVPLVEAQTWARQWALEGFKVDVLRALGDAERAHYEPVLGYRPWHTKAIGVG